MGRRVGDPVGFPTPQHFMERAAMPDDSLTLLQGTLDMLVLEALADEPMHGYGVAAWVRERSDDAFEIEEGALYTALHRMESRGWLRSEWGRSENNRRARFYEVTAAGRRQLERDAKRWRAYATAVAKVLGARGSEA